MTPVRKVDAGRIAATQGVRGRSASVMPGGGLAFLALWLVSATACSLFRPAEPAPTTAGPTPTTGRAEVGSASWYGKHHDGKRTASGERFDESAMTAAHPTLPFDTRVRVTNLDNGRSVIVRVNDRGPFAGGRIIDLSHAAAQALGIADKGVARVRLEALR